MSDKTVSGELSSDFQKELLIMALMLIELAETQDERIWQAHQLIQAAQMPDDEGMAYEAASLIGKIKADMAIREAQRGSGA